MVARIREFCRNESIGIVLPVAFISLYATWEVLNAVVSGFVYPVFNQAFGDKGGPFDRLDFRIGNVTFDWTLPLIQGMSFLVLLAIAYYVFVRPIPEDGEPDRGMRECPQCFSEIVIDARRCPFCTSAVEPLLEDQAETPEGMAT